MSKKNLFQSDKANLSKFTNVDGFVLLESYLKVKPLLDDWEVYDEDVWISGSPKTGFAIQKYHYNFVFTVILSLGTTWAQEMTWLLVNDLDYEKAKTTFKRRTPYWE